MDQGPRVSSRWSTQRFFEWSVSIQVLESMVTMGLPGFEVRSSGSWRFRSHAVPTAPHAPPRWTMSPLIPQTKRSSVLVHSILIEKSPSLNEPRISLRRKCRAKTQTTSRDHRTLPETQIDHHEKRSVCRRPTQATLFRSTQTTKTRLTKRAALLAK